MSTPQTAGAPSPGKKAAGKHRRQQQAGRVTSDKMQKTIVVAVESLKRHRIYQPHLQIHHQVQGARRA